MDEPDTLNYIIRDLQGYVLGKEYHTNKNGQMTVRNKPSLRSKVDYVKQNISALAMKYGFEPDIKEFESIIVTISYPPITEFNGIKMLSVKQITGLK